MRIRQIDQRCAVIVVTSVDKGDTLDRLRQLGISGILNKMMMKQNDIYNAVQRVCLALRCESDEPSLEAEEEKRDWKAFLFGNGHIDPSFEAQGMTGIRFFPGDRERLTPAMQRSLLQLILQRLGEPGRIYMSLRRVASCWSGRTRPHSISPREC